MLLDRQFTITIDPKIVLSVIATAALHLLILSALNSSFFGKRLDEIREFHGQNNAIKVEMPPQQTKPRVRTLGKKDGSKTNNVLVSPKESQFDKTKPLDPFKAAAAMNQPFKPLKQQPKPMKKATRGEVKQPQARPGTAAQAKMLRPEALERLASTSRPVQEVAQNTTQMAGQATIANSPILSKSNVNMQVEVPEGVAADELNEYELMFYGFQKRMMEKYLGAIMLQVREYERKYPHKSLIPEGQHVMTGRVTFDSSGNIKQIKMVRWSKADGLQSLFEDVLKSMDSVPNPPKKLWNKEGDFVVFYNLTVNNT